MTDGLAFTWYGWDGSEWDLSDSNGYNLQAGVRGLGMPPVIHHRSESPVVAGSRYRGSRVLQREVFWPLMISHTGTPTQYANRDQAFWDTMRPTKTGRWAVTSPAGTTREIRLRFESEDGSWEEDPLLRRRQLYGINLIAEQPFWAGTPVTHTFTNDGSFLVVNPGDVSGWTVWTLEGPISSGAVVGQLSNGTITVPVAVASGTTLTIYTQQDAMSAFLDDGTEVNLPQDAQFPYVPHERTHTVAFSGDGTISLSMTPYYYRAF